MANTVSRQLINNGPRNYVENLTIIGDGSGEETALRVNVTSGDMGLNNALEMIAFSTQGCSAQLLWDAATDVLVENLPTDFSDLKKYRRFGGKPNPGGTGSNGDLLITTNGLGSGDSIILLIHVRKLGS